MMQATYFDVTVTFTADRRTAVLAVAGELDLRTAEQLWPHLARLLGAVTAKAPGRVGRPGSLGLSARPDTVVLDGTALDFLDSSGLRVLLRGAKLAQGTGTALRIVAPNPVVQRVLELAGVARALDLRSSLPEAFA
jgi:ABC-type transporter Mla MlaB component